MNEDAEVTYPWQMPVFDAFIESRRKALPYKINAAERAIAGRLLDPREPDIDERLALHDALLALRALLPVRDWEAKLKSNIFRERRLNRRRA